MYCPFMANFNTSDISTWVSYCQPTDTCFANRMASTFCVSQGTNEPIVCPRGYYCPNELTKLPCPSGHFCTFATYDPPTCSAISSCPQGTFFKKEYEGLVICFLVDSVLVALYFVTRNFHRKPKPTFFDKSDKKPMNHLREAYSDVVHNKRMYIRFRKLSLYLPKHNKFILNYVTGSIVPGRITAIMGPSGAGKTTFLTALMGKADGISGSTSVNGNECHMSEYSKLIGFVPQNDVMIRELSVRDNIWFSARMRLPRRWTDAEVGVHVDCVIEMLGLSRVAYSQVGGSGDRGISGGELKRAN
eukprot:25735_1